MFYKTLKNNTMKKLDIYKIRGNYLEQEVIDGKTIAMSGGDDTIESIKMVAEKVNEIIDFLQDTNPKE